MSIAQRFDINFSSVMQGLILAAVLWVGKSVHDLQIQQAAVAVKLAEIPLLKQDVRELQAGGAANRQEIAIQERRITDLEQKR